MEVLEKGKTISIKSNRKFPTKDLLVDAGFVLILVWGVFTVLVVFFSQAVKEIVLYFMAISLLLVIPLVTGILIRQSRQFQEILFDGENGILSLKGMWRQRQIAFNDIKAFQINTYHTKRGTTLYRFEAALSSGRILRLIQDVPDKEEPRKFKIFPRPVFPGAKHILPFCRVALMADPSVMVKLLQIKKLIEEDNCE